ncbi:MAG: hypothetical protein JSU66_16930 [Deltaproteobacteria bacterium]|nr:MAG: hypothetical protein JSU66_16930 [Deltaproteobacteria bacterium]
MFPYSTGFMTMLQGLYSLIWIAVLMDVLSPTLDLRKLPPWSASEGLVVLTAIFTLALAVGTVMNTVSRNVFRRTKELWASEVLTSRSVRERLDRIGALRPTGGPSLAEVHAADGRERVRTAGEFVHAIEHVLWIRAPHVNQNIEIYRDQYRLARGFILPSLILAIVLPFWEVVPRGHMGGFPLISVQLFFLAVFFAGTSMYAFRERSYRYAAARIRAFLTLEREAQRVSETSQDPHLSAIA